MRDAIAEALAAEEPLELVAGGTKPGLGRPLQLPRTLDLSHLSGIRDYQPSELVLTAAAATPLAEIEAALAGKRQMLAFEPPDWGRLHGLTTSEAARRTLGGVLACNLSGPRRIKAGAARDHFLGFRGVSGRGEIFKSGGKVVKNVTGYDLSKLMAGSYGTLAALEEITVRVLPQPEHTLTVLLGGLDPNSAMRAMRQALNSPHEVSAATYLPSGSALSGCTQAVALRLEGPEPSVAFRRERLLAELATGSKAAVVEGEASTAFWRAIGDVEPFADLPDHVVWRVSLAPSRGAEFATAIASRLDAVWYLDWGGGLVWVAVPSAEDGRAGMPAAADGGAAVIRAVLHAPDGRGTGHATLVRGPPALRRTTPVFEPQPRALAALETRVKAAFDPRRILNPGRLGAEG